MDSIYNFLVFVGWGLFFVAIWAWIWSGLQKIPVGSRGLLLVLGRRLKRRIGEGWIPLPWPLGVKIVDCRQAVIELEPIEAITRDDVKVEIKGSIVRQVKDDAKSLWLYLNVDPGQLRQGLDDIWDEIIRTRVRANDLKEVLAMQVELGNEAKTHLQDHASVHWGIDILKVAIASITPADKDVMKDLELRKREELQRNGQRVQAAHFAGLVNFFKGTIQLDPKDPESPTGPGLSPELAYEAALIHIDKASAKDISSRTYGLDVATVNAIVAALSAIGGRR